jgi:hypothetical protein
VQASAAKYATLDNTLKSEEAKDASAKQITHQILAQLELTNKAKISHLS